MRKNRKERTSTQKSCINVSCSQDVLEVAWCFDVVEEGIEKIVRRKYKTAEGSINLHSTFSSVFSGESAIQASKKST